MVSEPPKVRGNSGSEFSLKACLNQPALLHGSRDEALEERMRLEGAAFQLRVELDADEPGVVRVFHGFGQQPVG